MTDDENALLAAVCAAPDDDNARLVYADYWQEHGQEERAEFIRVQCELAAVEQRLAELLNDDTDWKECTGVSAGWCPNCGDCTCRNPEDSLSDADCPLHSPHSEHCCLDELTCPNGSPALGIDDVCGCRHCTLRRRERELWHGLAPSLIGPPYTNVGLGRYAGACDGFAGFYARGFVESVTCPAAAWLKHGDALAWRPGQTVECENCGGRGYITAQGVKVACNWRGCDKGRVPRPCPPTAQPVTTVRLTTRPGSPMDWEGFVHRGDHTENYYTHDKFPGVTFELPEPTADDLIRQTMHGFVRGRFAQAERDIRARRAFRERRESTGPDRPA